MPATIVAGLIFAIFPVAGLAALVTIKDVSADNSDTLGTLAARAIFKFDDAANQLQIILSNESSAIVDSNPDVLTGLFFDIAGSPTLGLWAVQAERAIAESFIVYSTNVLNGGASNLDVSGEWAFRQVADFGPGLRDYGIGAAGYSPANYFGAPNVMSSFDRDGGSTPPNGGDFGILSNLNTGSTSTELANGANGFRNGGPYIQNSVVFNFVVTGTLNANSILNVAFTYGTASSGDPILTPPANTPVTGEVPEPASLAIWGLGALGCAVAARRRKLA